MSLVLNRKIFYDKIRSSLFAGHLTPAQVSAIDAKLKEFDRRGLTDMRWLAYLLATSYHETGRRMEPVREGFALSDEKARAITRHRNYGQVDPVSHQVYYGRGEVQLTWARNYKKFAALLGIPLYENPDLALIPANSAKIIYEGMVNGLFTGKSLMDYFNGRKEDWVGARRIVNAQDRALDIATYGKKFLAALTAAGATAKAPPLQPKEQVA